MTQVFISYSPKDKKHMTTMRQALLRGGFRPWIDPAPAPGKDWRFAIDDAIRSASVVLVIITPASAESVYVTYEWALALGQSTPVIPVIFKTTKMHPRLESLRRFEATAFNDEAVFWDHFIREMQRLYGLDYPGNNDQHEQTMTNTESDGRKIRESISPPVKTNSIPSRLSGPAYDRSVMPTRPGHWLVIRRGPELHTMFRLDKTVVTVGRDSVNDITIQDPEVSRYHLRLTNQGDRYAVEDLGSTNGTIIDSTPLRTGHRLLNPGAELRLGDTIILSYEVTT